MSENEFDFARKHVSDFKIHYVAEVLTKQPKILILDNVFIDNSFNHQNSPIDTRKEYKIAADYHMLAPVK
ncbi:hypothetical protein [Aneurinibacillus tyrosinisolvens]|uniref:hypothetical protein n=1 Tax=Aneurinibacillus tyrosinisolvens TaxID=1443435 RepID=UPI00063EF086|nr:hypothetical protein [Aneurinibacillus tyrosinisolvens]